MLKVHYQTDQEELFNLCGGHMSELIDTERGVKSAASDAIGRDILEQFRPDKDHFLQHVIAMGDYEAYGPNRNSDAWSKKANSEKHGTFVKYGHYFREHRHQNPSLAIGSIKYSAYSEPMQRIELLVWGSKKKAAAEYEAARRGEELSYSMAARVPHDVCNVCHHKAASPQLWCDHMKYHRLQYIPEFRKYAFVFNPDPKYFDISKVGFRADRIASYLRYTFGDEEGMAKAASGESQVVNGAEWAVYEGLEEPSESVVLAAGPARWLEKMAGMEHQLEHGMPDATAQLRAAVKAAGWLYDLNSFADSDIEALRIPEVRTTMRKLAQAGVLLPLPVFTAVTYGCKLASAVCDTAVLDAGGMMDGIFTAMKENGVAEDVCAMFAAGGEAAAGYDPKYDDEVERVIGKAEERFGVHTGVKRCAREVMLSALRDEPDPPVVSGESVVDIAPAKLAQSYAQYTLQALADMEALGGRVSDLELALVAGNNRKMDVSVDRERL